MAVPGVPGAFMILDVLSPTECVQMSAVADEIGFTPDHPLARDAPSGIFACEWLVDAGVLEAFLVELGLAAHGELAVDVAAGAKQAHRPPDVGVVRCPLLAPPRLARRRRRRPRRRRSGGGGGAALRAALLGWKPYTTCTIRIYLLPY